jgi:uncharacterized protein affecting Mg2+/Co2+ transport
MYSKTSFNPALIVITSITLLFVAFVTPSIFVAETQQSNRTDQSNNFEYNITINNTAATYSQIIPTLQQIT